MRIIDRLSQYLAHKGITAYSFERTCQVANGYLKKQQKGKGTVGSDILVRIYRNYIDLSLVWLITGEDEMLLVGSADHGAKNQLREEKQYYTKDDRIQFLSERIALLETSLADKKKIIGMLEAKTGKRKNK